jgi:biopolymer transport protein ExbD
VRLSEYLERIKDRFPDKTSATLLVAEDVEYDTIVQVMDAVRVRQSNQGGRVVRRELFPQIALGDAPT